MSFFFPSFCLPLPLYSFSGIFILDALLIYHRIETEKTVNIFFYLKKKKYHARNIVDALVASRLENKFRKYSRER